MQILSQPEDYLKEFMRLFSESFQVDIDYVCVEESATKVILPSSTIQENLDTALNHFCSVCHIFECLRHGDYRSREDDTSNALVDYNALTMKYPAVMARRTDSGSQPFLRKRDGSNVSFHLLKAV